MFRPLRVLAAALILALLAACTPFGRAYSEPVWNEGGVRLVTAVRGGKLTLYNGAEWKPLFWGGVNLGATTPGTFPGQLAATREDYLRWFGIIKAMNVHVMRIYTILPPHFYEALAEFNRGQAEPLRFMQGIWAPEEAMIGADEMGVDVFTPAIRDTFRKEISDAVRVVYGRHKLPRRRGHASGRYRTDVSQYLAGWILGVEWYPHAVTATNDAHPGMAPYRGPYFQATASASPFESWLAEMLDHVAAEESKFGWQHPAAFTNWATTDPLSHPNEPLRQEDLVSVDPLHVQPTSAWQAGYFAAYHVYPYYPDFLRFEPRYLAYRNHQGEPDPYAGYLNELRAYHKDIPLMITEFGMPSSRGMAHRAPLDRNQGMHTEQEQARLNADLLTDIYTEGYDGAFLFALVDEWHKFTWNTTYLERPVDNRAFWRNRLTNEEHFGVVAVEAGNPKKPLHIDGDATDWSWRWGAESRSYPGVKLSVFHDAAHVYLLLQRRDGDWDFTRDSLYVGFATLGKGSTKADKAPGVTFTRPAEFLLTVQEEGARLWVNSAYDVHLWRWGQVEQVVPLDPAWLDASAGTFVPWKLLLSRRLTLPVTGESVPPEDVEIGLLRRGITDPALPSFDSLADWYVDGPVLEIRLPWMMLGFMDPSYRHVWPYPAGAERLEPVTVKGFTVEPYVVRSGSPVPGPSRPLAYDWRTWEVPQYYERLKKSHGVLGELYRQYKVPRP